MLLSSIRMSVRVITVYNSLCKKLSTIFYSRCLKIIICKSLFICKRTFYYVIQRRHFEEKILVLMSFCQNLVTVCPKLEFSLSFSSLVRLKTNWDCAWPFSVEAI